MSAYFFIDEHLVEKVKRLQIGVGLIRISGISVVLKEEATRIRKAREYAEKQAKRKPWVHHPDRPITAQRQYLLW